MESYFAQTLLLIYPIMLGSFLPAFFIARAVYRKYSPGNIWRRRLVSGGVFFIVSIVILAVVMLLFATQRSSFERG